MKRLLSAALAVLLAMSLLTLPAQAAHEHQWADTWSKDETHHWHECSAPDCDVTENSEKDGYDEHQGDWTVLQEPTDRTAGKRSRTCTVCGWFQYEITPASLPTEDVKTLDLRTGSVTLTGDDMDALLNSLQAIPGAVVDEMNLMGPLMGYYADLDGDGNRDLTLTLIREDLTPDGPPDKVTGLRCEVYPGVSDFDFAAGIPKDRIDACLERGQPIYGMVDIRLTPGEGEFLDIAGHWAAVAVERAVRQGWVNGYPDGTFRPEDSVSRAEMTKMLLAATGLEPESDAARWMKETAPKPESSFTDMDENWLTTQGWTETALAAGLLVPADYPGGKFDPSRAITRGEIAVLTVRALGLSGPAGQDAETESPFTDSGSFPTEQAGFIREAAKAGIINGYPDGSFGAEKTATRAEAVVMVSRVLNVMDSGALSKLDQAERFTVDLGGLTLTRGCALRDGVIYVSLPELVKTLRILAPTEEPVYPAWDPAKQSLSFDLNGHTWTFAAGDSEVYRDGAVVEAMKLPAPISLVRGDLVIPVYDRNEDTPCGPWASQWDETTRTLTIPADWSGFGEE